MTPSAQSIIDRARLGLSKVPNIYPPSDNNAINIALNKMSRVTGALPSGIPIFEDNNGQVIDSKVLLSDLSRKIYINTTTGNDSTGNGSESKPYRSRLPINSMNIAEVIITGNANVTLPNEGIYIISSNSNCRVSTQNSYIITKNRISGNLVNCKGIILGSTTDNNLILDSCDVTIKSGKATIINNLGYSRTILAGQLNNDNLVTCNSKGCEFYGNIKLVKFNSSNVGVYEYSDDYLKSGRVRYLFFKEQVNSSLNIDSIYSVSGGLKPTNTIRITDNPTDYYEDLIILGNIKNRREINITCSNRNIINKTNHDLKLLNCNNLNVRTTNRVVIENTHKCIIEAASVEMHNKSGDYDGLNNRHNYIKSNVTSTGTNRMFANVIESEYILQSDVTHVYTFIKNNNTYKPVGVRNTIGPNDNKPNVFYIDRAIGSDANDGTTYSTPVATVERLKFLIRSSSGVRLPQIIVIDNRKEDLDLSDLPMIVINSNSNKNCKYLSNVIIYNNLLYYNTFLFKGSTVNYKTLSNSGTIYSGSDNPVDCNGVELENCTILIDQPTGNYQNIKFINCDITITTRLSNRHNYELHNCNVKFIYPELLTSRYPNLLLTCYNCRIKVTSTLSQFSYPMSTARFFLHGSLIEFNCAVTRSSSAYGRNFLSLSRSVVKELRFTNSDISPTRPDNQIIIGSVPSTFIKDNIGDDTSYDTYLNSITSNVLLSSEVSSTIKKYYTSNRTGLLLLTGFTYH